MASVFAQRVTEHGGIIHAASKCLLRRRAAMRQLNRITGLLQYPGLRIHHRAIVLAIQDLPLRGPGSSCGFWCNLSHWMSPSKNQTVASERESPHLTKVQLPRCRDGREVNEVRISGGEGGISTPDTLSGMAAFEAARFNHSRTSPRRGLPKNTS